MKIISHLFFSKWFLIFNILVYSQAHAATQFTIETTPYSFLETSDIQYFLKTHLQNRYVINKSWIAQTGLKVAYSDLENSAGKQYFINPTGTRLIYRNPSMVLALGFNTHEYKISQLMGPMDFVDQTNFWDPLNSERLADFSLRTSFKTGKVRWRVSYIPFRMKPVYPGSESFWLPRTLPPHLKTEDQNVMFPQSPTYEWEDTEVFRNSNKNNFSIMGEFENPIWLVRWGYYNGLDVDPNFHLELNLRNIDFSNFETIYPIHIIPVQNKIQRLGFGFRYTTPIKWRVFFENSISSGNAEDLVAEDYLYSSAFGLEWGIPFAGDILYGVFQGFYSISSEPDNSLGVLPPLREAAMAALMWKKPNYQITLAHIYSFSIDISLTQLATKVFLSKQFFAQGSANIFNGSVPELVSGIKKNDIIHLGLGYQLVF